ncbi:MAG: HAD-IB family hydrolase [Hellea sp.]|nr:HAD-IB family hydrolase [Hellea sp.]
MPEPMLAIFDLDYTLTRRGTWGRFTWQMAKYRPHIWIQLLISAGWTQWRYKKGHLPRVRVKQAMMRWCMVGKPRETMISEAKKFAEREVSSGLRPGGLTKLRAHQEAGDHILLVSAAVDIIVREICERLGVEDYLATNMDWDENNRLKEDFASANCYGPEKILRLETFLTSHPDLKNRPSIMYSDSHSDIPIMEFCDSCVAVNPSEKLEKYAREHGIPIENWD